ncbi:unnamed protein product [Arctogadus glacialis]
MHGKDLTGPAGAKGRFSGTILTLAAITTPVFTNNDTDHNGELPLGARCSYNEQGGHRVSQGMIYSIVAAMQIVQGCTASQPSLPLIHFLTGTLRTLQLLPCSAPLPVTRRSSHLLWTMQASFATTYR